MQKVRREVTAGRAEGREGRTGVNLHETLEGQILQKCFDFFRYGAEWLCPLRLCHLRFPVVFLKKVCSSTFSKPSMRGIEPL